MRRTLILVLLGLTAGAQQPPTPTDLVKFQVSTNLVVVNVTVKDKSGNPILGLTKDQFQIFEDDKPQAISVFELQNLSHEKLPVIATEKPPEEPDQGPKPEVEKPKKKTEKDLETAAEGELKYKDRRLLVLFFDLASMKPAEEIRAQQAALKFIAEQMTASDLVCLMTFKSSLTVDVDFTDDREQLIEAIQNLPIGEMAEFSAESPGPLDLPADEEEDAGKTLFTADDAEFNIFNTDRKLSALESAVKYLGTLPEKKALVYLSAGVGRTGVENQAQLRATINWAIRSNVAFYPVDARGLVAMPPAGDATQAAVKGTAIYSGALHRQQFGQLHEKQETLYSLAADTGGKALLDNNDLTLGIVQAQKDINTYYILGYYSTNAAEDGKFRRIRVRIPSRPDAKLDYRSGYFANKVWKDFTAADKERQLEEAMQLENPKTEVPMALEINWFRTTSQSYFVPIAIKLPGAVVGMAKKGKDQIAELDFAGKIMDVKGKTVASVRDTIRVKLNDANASEWTKKPIEYDTGFSLPPGRYKLRFVVRENQTGKLGTFDTRFEIPDLNTVWTSLRMSTVVWANQFAPLSEAVASATNDKKLLAMHPLVQENRKLVPSITKVYRRDQNLYVYFEVYDPRMEEGRPPSVAATLSLFRNAQKAYESTPVRVTQLAPSRNRTMPFQFQLPLKDLEPGQYICQVNVIDEIGRKFSFPRAPLVLLP